MIYFLFSVSCSHGRAYLFYADSILHPHSFKAYQCENWEAFEAKSCKNHSTAYMGDETPSTYGLHVLTRGSCHRLMNNTLDECFVTGPEEFITFWRGRMHRTGCRIDGLVIKMIFYWFLNTWVCLSSYQYKTREKDSVLTREYDSAEIIIFQNIWMQFYKHAELKSKQIWIVHFINSITDKLCTIPTF